MQGRETMTCTQSVGVFDCKMLMATRVGFGMNNIWLCLRNAFTIFIYKATCFVGSFLYANIPPS